MVKSGLDVLVGEGFARLRGKRIGVVCHQASIARDHRHVLDHLLPLHREGKLEIAACFGPQHGIWGHTQDNMIEWEGYVDERTGLKFYSLYGEHRQPTAAMLEGIDVLVVDVQDVGSRYYTFIWTLAHCMESCGELRIPVLILDRPNPIGGALVEGPGHDMAFKSFVGLYSLPVRHGLTVGEIGLYLRDNYLPRCGVDVVAMEGWNRLMMWRHTGLPWSMPSPNMPGESTALVYPGQCLVEGTQISEGRGTTRPFEFFGAPYIESWAFCDELNRLDLPGAWFRPVYFQPTFQKFKGVYCGGAFLHVTDEEAFRPVLTTVAMLGRVRAMYGERFFWLEPPYEYEYNLLPIDILAGGEEVRRLVDGGASVEEMREFIGSSSAELESSLLEYHLYR
jgi:uncharacterized protein YbbC (DUF1343 family)